MNQEKGWHRIQERVSLSTVLRGCEGDGLTAVEQVQRATRREVLKKRLSGKDNTMEPLKIVEDISMTNLVMREEVRVQGKLKKQKTAQFKKRIVVLVYHLAMQ